ncbi:O-antigen ligase family protein [Paludibaculum fermentans]|uniref:O-antigen ligase family protein n=1 Tax=Paludibaculum fermentans TaxID=1473598 RepID=UPI003EB82D78
MITKATRITAWTLAALLAFGISTLWVRERWAVALFQGGVLLLSLIWLWMNAWLKGPFRWDKVLIPLALLPIIGAVQVIAGLTVLPWFTVESTIGWTVTFLSVFLLLQAMPDPAFQQSLRTALLAFAAILTVVSVLQVFTSQGKAFWIFDTGYDSDVLGPFVYRNKYAQFVELVFPLTLWRALIDRRRAPLYLTAGAVMAAGVVAGASRSGASFLLAEIALVLLAGWRRKAISGRGALLVAGQAGAMVVLWGFLAGWDFFWQRLTGLDPAQDFRWPIMHSTLEMIRLRPWTGFGLGTWPLVYPQFATFDIGVVVNQAHCDWLQWTADGGLPFLAAVVAAFGLLLRRLILSVWGIGFLVVAVHAAIDYPFHQLPAFHTFLWCTAVLAAAGERNRHAPQS